MFIHIQKLKFLFSGFIGPFGLMTRVSLKWLHHRHSLSNASAACTDVGIQLNKSNVFNLTKMRLFLLIIFSCIAISNCTAYEGRVLNNKEIDTYVKQLEDYLNSIKTIVSKFLQVGRYGDKSNGYFLLKRPGKMKLFYQHPATDVIMAKDDKITHYNRELKEKTISSMHSSPLSFFLERKINLRGNVKVLSAVEQADEMVITFSQKNDEAEGAVSLFFKKNPIKLLKWEIFNNKNNIAKDDSTKILLLDSEINTKKINDDEFDKLMSFVEPRLVDQKFMC
ncbi:hypothetical protein FACS189449_03940 [Alphaproteobacteria bacterium]|nr:hypothetical protein FACS189449_03940 [Alphaproteobacteria bacterium]